MTTPPPESSSNYSGEPSSDDRTMALICHFGMILFAWLPALIIYIVRGESPWVKKEAAKAFNFAIAIQVGYVVFFVLQLVFAVLDLSILGCISTLAYVALWVALVVFGIINGMKVNNNEETRYPFEIPLLK